MNKTYISTLILAITLLCTNAHTMAESTMQNTHFTFKKLTQEDWPLLLQWFKEPHVEKWWPTPEENELMEYFLEKIRCKSTFGFVVFLDEKPIGYIQYYYIDRSKVESGSLLPPLPDETTVGIDQFIGDPNYLHKGYGTLFIKQFITELPTLKPELTTVIIDADPENLAAIRCYEKVGFVRVCTYENPWGTSLVMRYDI
jgi:RimJ/RimL family protein N-acetyltransferase